MAARMLHGVCFGEEAGARNLLFFCVEKACFCASFAVQSSTGKRFVQAL